jgi:hypothetical protein
MHDDTRHFADKARLETQQRRAGLEAYVEEAIRQAMRNRPREVANDRAAIYHRSFPIGKALADIFTHRAVVSNGPLSLIHVIEWLIGEIPSESPEQQVRRGILAGLCWELGATLQMGGKGGIHFNVHDEGRMLMGGVRRSRDCDARMICELTESDDDDPSCEGADGDASQTAATNSGKTSELAAS